jgi:hypothetical protein
MKWRKGSLCQNQKLFFLQPNFPRVEQLDIFAGLILLKYLVLRNMGVSCLVWRGGLMFGSRVGLIFGLGAGFRLGLQVAPIWVGRGWVLRLGLRFGLWR